MVSLRECDSSVQRPRRLNCLIRYAFITKAREYATHETRGRFANLEARAAVNRNSMPASMLTRIQYRGLRNDVCVKGEWLPKMLYRIATSVLVILSAQDTHIWTSDKIK